jgi:hypothetical protein
LLKATQTLGHASVVHGLQHAKQPLEGVFIASQEFLGQIYQAKTFSRFPYWLGTRISRTADDGLSGFFIWQNLKLKDDLSRATLQIRMTNGVENSLQHLQGCCDIGKLLLLVAFAKMIGKSRCEARPNSQGLKFTRTCSAILSTSRNVKHESTLN